MARKYDETSIKRYAGLLGIRKKPTPYIGPPDSDGLWTCWREPADNCVDQVLRGNNTSVHLIMDKEPNRYWVVDTGKGIPTAVQEFENEHGKKEKHSTLYVVTGLTHGGANFDSEEISRGTHGIGIKATNAMSKLFTVWTCWKGQWWAIEFKNAAIHKMPYKTKAPKLPHGMKIKHGTVVMFEPDLSLFHKGTRMSESRALEWCKLTSYLVKGMEVKYTSSKGKTKTFKTAGPQQFLHDQIEELKASQTGKSFVYSDKEMDIAIGFTDAEGDNMQAYTNGLHNKEGGEHVKAVQKALFDSLNSFKEDKSTKKTTRVKKAAKKPKKGKKEGASFRIADLCDGLAGLMNFKIAAPQFSSQVKDKLTDDRVYPIAHKTLMEQLSAFWSKHPGMAKDVIARATLLRTKTSDFLKDKKLVKNVNAAKRGMSVKLAGVIGNAPKHERELFIVEGDSAGGSAKQSRDSTFQAVYPLKGKPLNVMETTQDKINANKEVVGLLAALGIDMSGKARDPEPAYGKIILLADADVDGSHINTLILGVLYKFVPSLLRDGRIFSVRSPLYKGNKGLDVFFGMTREEVWKNAGSKVDVTYLKGWGEVNPEDLGIALDPSLRTLIKINEADKKGKLAFEQLLGKSPAFRKQLLGVE